MIKHGGKRLDRRTLCFSVALIFFAQSLALSISSSPNHVKVEVNRRLAKVRPIIGQSQPIVPPDALGQDFYKEYLRMLYESPNADPFNVYKNVFAGYVTARLIQKLTNDRRLADARHAARSGADVDTEYFFGTVDLSSE